MTIYADVYRFVWKGNERVMECESYIEALAWIVSMLPSTGFRIGSKNG